MPVTFIQKSQLFKRVILALLLGLSLPLSSCQKGIASDALCATDRLLQAYVLSSTANSDGGTDGLAYYINSADNTAVVAQGSCTASSVVIPATYNTTYTVVGINASGFANDTALTSITFALPSGASSASNITMIGSQAFLNTSLTSFTVPVNVSVINPSSFRECRSLASFSFATGSTCTSILDHAFSEDVALDSAPFPSGLVSLGEAAYQGCIALVRAIFPLSFTTLGEAAFENCVSLGLIYFQTNVSSIGSFAFKNCSKAWAFFAGDLPSGYSATGQWWNYLYGSYSGSTSYPTLNSAGSVLTTAADFIPVYTNKSTLNYNSGFYYTKYLSSDPARDYDVIIILYNGSQASDTAGSVDLTIPNTLSDDDGTHRVIGIDKSAFADHTELKTVTFAANLQFINEKAFYNCANLSSIGLTGATSLKTIGVNAFSNDSTNTVCTSLTIPASVTTIGDSAFYSFTNLASLTFVGASDSTASLTSIGVNAFQYAGNNFSGSNSTNGAVVFPSTLTSVASSAFSSARFIYSLSFKSTGSLSLADSSFRYLTFLASVTLPSGATSISIGANAFGETAGSFNGKTLHSIYLPANVTSVGSKAFNGRLRLTIYVGGTSTSRPSGFNSAFASSDSVSLGDSVSNSIVPVYYNVEAGTSSRHLLHYSVAGQGEFDFLETTANASTSILTRYYYDGSSSVSLTPTVPSSVTINGSANTPTSIGANAFIWSTVNSIPQPGSAGIWSNNSGSCLTKLTLPNTIASIGDYAFTTCTLLTEITNGTASTFPTALRTLGTYAFTYSGLLKAYLPVLTSIASDNPFLGCFQLSVLQINADATTNGQTYYSDNNNIYKASTASNYNELVLGADGAATFNGSSTDQIAWGCTLIDSKAYRGQRKVTSISLPYTLQTIGSYFMDSIGKAYDASGVSGSNALTSVRFYTNDSTNYPSSRCTSIGEIAFWGCSNLVTMEFPASLTSIGNQAFNGCSSLAYCPKVSSGSGTSGLLDLSSTSISTLGTQAFTNCSSLTSLILPSTLTSISDSAFTGCSKIASLTLGSATASIGASSFSACSSLTSLTLPSTVTSVGGSAFSGDSALVTVNLSSSLTSLASNSFNGCTAMTSLKFSNSQTSNVTLTGTVFQNCSKLTSVVLPKGVICTTTPFWGCSKLADASAGTGTIKGLFLNMTGTEYSSVYGTNLPQGWNYYKSGTPVTYACHATSSAEAVCSIDSSMRYWHYVSGVPTMGYGADS